MKVQLTKQQKLNALKRMTIEQREQLREIVKLRENEKEKIKYHLEQAERHKHIKEEKDRCINNFIFKCLRDLENENNQLLQLCNL